MFVRGFFIYVSNQNNPLKSGAPVLLLFRNGMIYMTPILLQAANLISGSNSASDYLPIAIQLLFAGGFVFLVLGVTHLLGPKRNTDEKLKNFENRIHQIQKIYT